MNWDSSYEYDDSGIHGDVEYIYHVDIFTNTVEVSVEGIYYDKTPDRRYDEKWEVISSYSDVSSEIYPLAPISTSVLIPPSTGSIQLKSSS